MPAIYTNARNLMLNPTGTLGAANATSISWVGDTIHAVLVNATETYVAGDVAFNTTTVPAANRVGPADGVALTGKSVTNGIATAANTTFTGVTTGTVSAVLIVKMTAGAAGAMTGILIAYLDTGGFPFTPNGDVTLVWSTTDGIIKLP